MARSTRAWPLRRNIDDGISVAAARAGTPASLTSKQRERLLFGYWSLSQLWHRLRSTSPTFQQADQCTNHQQCLSTWNQVWRDLGKSEATLKHPAGDVPSRLRAMERYLFSNMDMYLRLSHALTPQCREGAVAALRTTIKEVQDSLGRPFLVPDRYPIGAGYHIVWRGLSISST